MKHQAYISLILLFCIVLLVILSVSIAGFPIERIDVAGRGTPVAGPFSRSYSADKRYVAFWTSLPDLVTGDLNKSSDVFVTDQVSNTTEIISVSSTGEQSNGHCSCDSISSDGRYVAFISDATNLDPKSTNEGRKAFVRDRTLCTTKCVSLSQTGEPANKDIVFCIISADGRFVAYLTRASNLVPGFTDKLLKVFVCDRISGAVECVSVSSNGEHANYDSSVGSYISLSSDARYIAFNSSASNLVPGSTNHDGGIFVRDRILCTTECVSLSHKNKQVCGYSSYPSISADGRYVAFESNSSILVAEDTNYRIDVFVHDRKLGTTERISITSDEEQAEGSSYYASISPDGRYVTFQSDAKNLLPPDKKVDPNNSIHGIFIRDRTLGTTECISFTTYGPIKKLLQNNQQSIK